MIPIEGFAPPDSVTVRADDRTHTLRQPPFFALRCFMAK